MFPVDADTPSLQGGVDPSVPVGAVGVVEYPLFSADCSVLVSASMDSGWSFLHFLT